MGGEKLEKETNPFKCCLLDRISELRRLSDQETESALSIIRSVSDGSCRPLSNSFGYVFFFINFLVACKFGFQFETQYVENTKEKEAYSRW